MEYFEYKGKNYPYKLVYFQNEDIEYLISCEELNSILFSKNADYDSDYAKKIDEQIMFYVPMNILRESDDEIEKFVNEAI